MKKLYISRALSSDSLFWELREEGFEIIDFSLLQINSIVVKSWPSSDWVFFYSPRAIDFYFQQQTYDDKIKYGVMSSGSARAFQSMTGYKADFVGDGNAARIAEQLNKLCKQKKILIPKAVHSVHSLATFISKDVELLTVDIYANTKSQDFDIPSCDVLVFTSPLNVEAYFDKYPVKDEKIFAIGSTTAEKIASLTKKQVPYCRFPNESNLYKLIREVLNLD